MISDYGRFILKKPLNFLPVNVPATFRVTTEPETPAELGKVSDVLAIAPPVIMPTVLGSGLLVAAAPSVALVMLTLEAVRYPTFFKDRLAVIAPVVLLPVREAEARSSVVRRIKNAFDLEVFPLGLTTVMLALPGEAISEAGTSAFSSLPET